MLVVDDFMRAGGSINGVMNLMNEFKAEEKGICTSRIKRSKTKID